MNREEGKKLREHVKQLLGAGLSYDVQPSYFDLSPAGGTHCRPPPEKRTTPIVGYRVWNAARYYPGGWELLSAGDTIWPARSRLEARCLGTHTFFVPPTHDAPVSGCMCGIYAMRDRVQLPHEPSTTFVAGEVYLWGRVFEHSDGWRGQYAYPKHLVVIGGDQAVADALSMAYGVPAEVWS